MSGKAAVGTGTRQGSFQTKSKLTAAENASLTYVKTDVNCLEPHSRRRRPSMPMLMLKERAQGRKP